MNARYAVEPSMTQNTNLKPQKKKQIGQRPSLNYLMDLISMNLGSTNEGTEPKPQTMDEASPKIVMTIPVESS